MASGCSALDNAVWSHVVEVHGEEFAGKHRRDIAFPVFTDQAQFKHHKAIPLLGAEARQVIEAAQPFCGDGPADCDALWALHEAWNVDKHRELTVIHMVAHTVHAQTRPPTDGRSVEFVEKGSLVAGAEVARLTVPWTGLPSELKVDADLLFVVGVRPSWRIPGIPLDAGIAEMRSRVDDLLDRLSQ